MPTPSSAPRPLPLVQVGDVLVSGDCLTECFCCDLAACHGACCVEGDAGAPLALEEAAELENVLNAIWEDLSPEARRVVRRQGVAYTDPDGDLVTSIVDGRDCAFAFRSPDGCCFCAAEKAWREGRTRWCKPVSCALYPIRERRLANGLTALNYHRWEICAPAVEKGRALGLPVYRFLREPLVRRFGAEWYASLEATADALRREGMIP